MKRIFALSTAVLLALGACGDGTDEPAGDTQAPGAQQPAGDQQAGASGDELQTPDWYQYDEAANTVTLDLVAGGNADNNYWNYNGYENGEVTVFVPTGAEVTVNMQVDDPNLAHSVGVAAAFSNSTPPANLDPEPVFDGAITPNATDPINSTQPGESASFTFTADQAGEYALVCYVPAHAVSGMWIGFTVSDEGEAGVRGAL